MRIALASLLALLTACERRPLPRSEPVVAAVSASAPPAAVAVAPSGPAGAGVAPGASVAGREILYNEAATVQRLPVPGDREASVVATVPGEAPRIVFLPGLCSNAYAYLLSFPEAARRHGGIVALDGDLPCGPEKSGFRSFSGDPEKQHRRITAALVAAGATTLPREGLTLVGYSLGATIAERLVRTYPDRYGRLVIIGAPHDALVANYREARGVVTMSCSLDVTSRMKQGAARIARTGVPATYLEMPGCTHGNIAQGERVFEETFAWLDAHALPTRAEAVAAALPLGRASIHGDCFSESGLSRRPEVL